MSKAYFKNLDGLRFFAALLVILEHCAIYKQALDPKISSIFQSSFSGVGGYGVKFFFVLSGFLISFLLLKEIQTNGKIDIKAFYIRRVLRIWPLYFLVGVFGIVISPLILKQFLGDFSSDILQNLAFLFTFNVNHQLLYLPFDRGVVEILWSVAIEEQYYLLFAPLLFLGRKRPAIVLILFLVIGALAPSIHNYCQDNLGWALHQPNYYSTLNAFLFFGVGGLGAYIFSNWGSRDSAILLSKPSQWFFLVGLLIYVFNPFTFNVDLGVTIKNALLALAFLYLIFISISQNSVLKFEKPWLKTLGRISYGIYVYHTFVAFILLRLLHYFVKENGLVMEVFYPALATGITIAISYFSYQKIEKPFLKMKSRYSKISSAGD